jgi:hypothetical protein
LVDWLHTEHSTAGGTKLPAHDARTAADIEHLRTLRGDEHLLKRMMRS